MIQLISGIKTKYFNMNNSNKHENYEVLNLIGYGLAKFDKFSDKFGFTSKDSFYQYCVDIKIADTKSTIKNRQDLFDPFFENGRRGWWQKGNAYIHRKIKIDTLFGNEDLDGYVNIVKLYLQSNFEVKDLVAKSTPLINSRFKQMQETGLEAELFFMNNFREIPQFKDAEIEDARLFGDGYDFQVSVDNQFFLVEVKGIRAKKGKFRITQNEFNKATEYKEKYAILTVLDLDNLPIMKTFYNPLEILEFERTEKQPKIQVEYHLKSYIC
jgi:Domain of unknown function (DUF3883)